MIFTGCLWIQGQIKLILPAKFKTGLAQGIVALDSAWVTLRKISSIG